MSNVPIFVEDFEVYNDYNLVKPGTTKKTASDCAVVVNCSLWREGSYTIIGNPNFSHSSFADFPARGGSGKMLVANGKNQVDRVWSRRISGLKKGQAYAVELYAAKVHIADPAILQFKLNSVFIGVPLTLNSEVIPTNAGGGNTAQWQLLQASFIAPASEFVLGVVGQKISAGGNDFAIDDIRIFDATTTYFYENFEYESKYNYVEPGNSLNLSNGNLSSPFTYTIDTNPKNSHSLFALPDGFLDHTSGSGKMMVVNGDAADLVWSRKVNNLQVGASYSLQAFAANVYNASPAKLRFKIQQGAAINSTAWEALGQQIIVNTIPAFANGQNDWTPISVTFTASSSDVVFALFDENGDSSGNDFALDDIMLCKGSCSLMAVRSISPMNGVGLANKFTYVFKGASSIQSGKLLLNTAPFENGSGCAIEFLNDLPTGTFRMVYNNAQFGRKGESKILGTIQDQCMLDLSLSDIRKTDDTLTVEAYVRFPDPNIYPNGPIGQLFNYAQLTSTVGQLLDWYSPATDSTLEGAQWSVASGAGLPIPQTTQPASWDGTNLSLKQQQFTFRINDANGSRFITGFTGFYLLGGDQTGNNCIFSYNRQSDSINLYDANLSPARVVRSGARTATDDLGNGFCVIHTGGTNLTTLATDSAGMSVSLTIEFLRGFDGLHQFYAYAYDPIFGGRQSGETGQLGEVTAWGAGPAILSPSAITVGPQGTQGSFSVSTGSRYMISTTGNAANWFMASQSGSIISYTVAPLPAGATVARTGTIVVTTTAWATPYISSFTITQTPSPDFTISLATPTPELARTSFTRTYTVTLNRLNGYVADVDLSAILPALPAGSTLTYTFSPQKLSGTNQTQTSTLTITTGATGKITQWGNYAINVLGKGAVTTKSASLNLSVQDYYVTASPFRTFTSGSGGSNNSFDLTITYNAVRLNNYSQPITVKVPPVTQDFPINPWYYYFCPALNSSGIGGSFSTQYPSAFSNTAGGYSTAQQFVMSMPTPAQPYSTDVVPMYTVVQKPTLTGAAACTVNTGDRQFDTAPFYLDSTGAQSEITIGPGVLVDGATGETRFNLSLASSSSSLTVTLSSSSFSFTGLANNTPTVTFPNGSTLSSSLYVNLIPKPGTPQGSYAFTITPSGFIPAVSGTLMVNGTPAFSLGAPSPSSQEVGRGSSVQYSIPVTFDSGFAGPVSFATNVTTGGGCNFADISVTPPAAMTVTGTANVIVAASSTSCLGYYSIAITASATGVPSKSVTLTATVQPPKPARVVSPAPNTKLTQARPDFYVRVPPGVKSFTVQIGKSPTDATYLPLTAPAIDANANCPAGIVGTCVKLPQVSQDVNVSTAVYAVVNSVLSDGSAAAPQVSVYNVTTKEFIYINNKLIAIETVQ